MKSASELITVVIPVYNRAGQVVETLNSVAGQTVKPSLIIVDNNSSDSSLAVVKQWVDANRSENFPISVFSQLRGGAAAARNRGLNNVTTPWTVFFDSDDIMLPGHIERIVQTITANPDATLIGWDTEWHTLANKVVVHKFPIRNLVWNNIFRSALSTLNYTATTALFRQAGRWDANLRGWDDYELGMRLLMLNPTIVKATGAPEVIVRCQTNSITGTHLSTHPEKWEHSLNCCEQVFIFAAMPQAARCINLKRAVLAGLYLREKSYANYRRLLETALSREKSAFRRLLLRIAARYTSLGGRGIHLLLKPVFNTDRSN